VSESCEAVPAPWVLDVSVLAEVARGDARTMTLIQELAARARPLIIPALAVAGASLGIRSEEAAELLEGLERLGNAMVAPLPDAEQAVRLAAVIASVCPILTLAAAKWQRHAEDLGDRLYVIEIADPGQPPEDSSPER
jgi:hypothetical protein